MAGYWRNDEATRECFSEPGSAWPTLRTGDYGYVDEDSRLYVLGRRDDVFKRSCVRMSVQDVEAALLDVPGVAAAAVLPPDADGQLVAWVVSESPAREVLDLMAQRVDRIRVPDRCMVVPELPATANGKVDRAALRAGLSEWHQ
jgi:acyl-coenzyme A synthetase/AMP-(fatty) acid ligase